MQISAMPSASCVSTRQVHKNTLRASRAVVVKRAGKSMARGRQFMSSQVCRAREEIHPEFHDEAKVYCNGEEEFTVGGVVASYDVDIWSGNHPVFQEAGGANTLVDEGHVNRFKDRFGDLGEFGYGFQEILMKFK